MQSPLQHRKLKDNVFVNDFIVLNDSIVLLFSYHLNLVLLIIVWNNQWIILKTNNFNDDEKQHVSWFRKNKTKCLLLLWIYRQCSEPTCIEIIRISLIFFKKQSLSLLFEKLTLVLYDRMFKKNNWFWANGAWKCAELKEIAFKLGFKHRYLSKWEWDCGHEY